MVPEQGRAMTARVLNLRRNVTALRPAKTNPEETP